MESSRVESSPSGTRTTVVHVGDVVCSGGVGALQRACACGGLFLSKIGGRAVEGDGVE